MRRRILSRYNVDPDSDPPFKPPVTHVFTGPLTPHYETRSFPPGTLAQHARQGSQSNQPLMSEIPHKEDEDENKLRPNRWSDVPSPQVIRTAGEASWYHEELTASSNQSLSAFRANSAPSSKSGSLISRVRPSYTPLSTQILTMTYSSLTGLAVKDWGGRLLVLDL